MGPAMCPQSCPAGADGGAAWMLAEVRSKSGHDTFWRQRRVTEEKSKHRITRGLRFSSLQFSHSVVSDSL